MNSRLNPDLLSWSAEAEQAVLGGLMLDNRAYDIAAAMLDARHFFDSRHAAIWNAITSLVVAGKPADVVTVFEALQNLGKAEDASGLPYLNALSQSVPSA